MDFLDLDYYDDKELRHKAKSMECFNFLDSPTPVRNRLSPGRGEGGDFRVMSTSNIDRAHSPTMSARMPSPFLGKKGGGGGGGVPSPNCSAIQENSSQSHPSSPSLKKKYSFRTEVGLLQTIKKFKDRRKKHSSGDSSSISPSHQPNNLEDSYHSQHSHSSRQSYSHPNSPKPNIFQRTWDRISHGGKTDGESIGPGDLSLSHGHSHSHGHRSVPQSPNPSHTSRLSSFCCHGRPNKESPESSDEATLTPKPPPGESVGESASVSVNVSCSPASTVSTHSRASLQHQDSMKGMTAEGIVDLDTEKKVEFHDTVMGYESKHPFHVLHIHLNKGRNLVARDACGSSDPYVKVKVGDKIAYKSKTVSKNLNPVWDESFTLPIHDIYEPVIFKVYDYDWGFQDDYMGMTSVEPWHLPLNQNVDLTLILTENNIAGTEPMGDIFVSFSLEPRTSEDKENLGGDATATRSFDTPTKRMKTQAWNAVLTVLMIEVKNLPSTDESVVADCYLKFRVGQEKFKTRVIPRATNPRWGELFDLYLYDGQQHILEFQLYDEAFSKECSGWGTLDLDSLEKDKTREMSLKLSEGSGEIFMLITVSGTSGPGAHSDLSSYVPNLELQEEIVQRYALWKTFSCLRDVGHLTVRVFEAQGLAALDIGGKSDPFCVLELVNSRVRTQTQYRTLCPVWNKIFTFEVLDITSILEITIFDEDKNHKSEFLGKLDLPLWQIKSGEKKWYMLKDQKMLRPAPGNNPKILLQVDLEYNTGRAGIRVLDPPEMKILQPDQRLKRETFLLNIDRLKKIIVTVYEIIQYIESCLMWEYPVRSIIALVTYETICYTFQPYFIPLFIMILMLKQWLMRSLTATPLLEEEINMDENILDGGDDDDDGKEGDDKKMTLRQKVQAVQDATQTLQNALGQVASICESTRNAFRMTVPFISWLVVIATLVASVILYFVPVRYLAMAYGFHKFFRPILRPNMVPTNEAFNVVTRVPDNLELVYFRPLKPSVTKPGSGERSRSPPAGPSSGPKEAKKKHKFW